MWTSKSSGKLKETEHPVDGGEAQQSSHGLEQDGAELESSAPCSSNSHEEQGGKVPQVAKSHRQVFSHSQPKEIWTQLQGVTPVKLYRKELRPIPASELSSRRSGLTDGINPVVDNSFEMSRKPNDFNI